MTAKQKFKSEYSEFRKKLYLCIKHKYGVGYWLKTCDQNWRFNEMRDSGSVPLPVSLKIWNYLNKD